MPLATSPTPEVCENGLKKADRNSKNFVKLLKNILKIIEIE